MPSDTADRIARLAAENVKRHAQRPDRTHPQTISEATSIFAARIRLLVEHVEHDSKSPAAGLARRDATEALARALREPQAEPSGKDGAG